MTSVAEPRRAENARANALLTRVAGSHWVPPVVPVLAARVLASPLAYRFARGAFWSVLGAVLGRVTTVVAAAVTARVLGVESFGRLGIINSTIGMFQVFAGFGLGVTGTTYIARFRRTDPAKASSVLALSAVLSWTLASVAAVLVVLLSPWLARVVNAPELAPLFRISALALFVSVVNGAQTGVLAGFEAFRPLARINLLAGLLSFPAIVGAVWVWGLTGAVWATATAPALQWLLSHLAIAREARAHGIALHAFGWRRESGIVWRFSLPAAFAGLMVGPINWACSALLVNQPGGYEQMGIFNAANQWFGAVLFLPTIIGSAMLPVLSERVGAKDASGQSKLLKASMATNAVVVLPIVAVMCAASSPLMRMYGSAFSASGMTLVIVAITAGVLAVLSPVGQLLIASSRLWTAFAMNAGWAGVFLLGSAGMVRWGASGLASARLVAYLVHSSWTLAFAAHVLRRARLEAK